MAEGEASKDGGASAAVDRLLAAFKKIETTKGAMDLAVPVFLPRDTASDVAKILSPELTEDQVTAALDACKFEKRDGGEVEECEYSDLEKQLKEIGVFKPTKKDRMQAYFRIVDTDGNGHIDSSELRKMMKRVNAAELEGLSEEDAKEELDAMVEEIMEAVDSNADGVIEWEEFKVLDF